MIFILALLETGARIFWAFNGLRIDAEAADIYHYFYPELDEIRPAAAGVKRVLLLGGSVLLNARQSISGLLAQSGEEYVVYSTAQSAQSSRDSLIKYRLLANEKFDLVVFYHGINEVRANNIPPGLFRDDYSHYSWYEFLNILEQHSSPTPFLLPVSARLAWLKFRQELNSENYVPPHGAGDDLLRYGGDIRTRPVFESNLKAIIELAKEKQEKLVVMSFAWHLPRDYTREKFELGVLDYSSGPGLFATPTEIWGTPENVEKGIRQHNEVIRQIVGRPETDVIFVDQEMQIPKTGEYFTDICHMTPSGYRLFAQNLITALP